MDLSFSAEDEAFRQEVRDFIAENLPADTRARARRNWSYMPKEDHIRWQKALYERGWVAPNWPVEYGGPGWDITKKFIFEEETARAEAPRLVPFGLMMVGPVIYTFGNDEQKERYLPRILRSEDWWCQGYSEPGSGSDLASLQTKAVRDGDHYVVNGHKIWTSGAHKADMMFALVRTQPEGKPQEGISFLLIDMNDPGITVKPIVTMDDNHYLNEVFLDDVRVPVANRIGEENKGWTYAKYLLGHERTGIAGVGRSKIKAGRIRDIAAVEGAAGQSLAEDDSFMQRLAQVETELTALEYSQLRMLAGMASGKGPGPESSILKIRGTEIEQQLNEMAVEALGYYASPYGPEQWKTEWNEPPVGPEHGIGLMCEHLLRRAASIYGGSNEIQRNVIAKAVLEM